MINGKHLSIVILALLTLIGGTAWFLREDAAPTPNLGGAFEIQDFQVIGGVYRKYTAGQCFGGRAHTDAATSTLFSIQNPWQATSTIDLATLYGLQGATTTDILIGTSTVASPTGVAGFITSTSTATMSLSYNLFAMYNVAANSQFNTVAGLAGFGPGTGYTNPSSGSYPTSQGTIVVGPNEYVVGFSTSTAPGNTGRTGINWSTPVSCNFNFVWTRL